MSKGTSTARGVFSNWTALAVSFVVAFFLSPFIVHHLGVVAYGVWALVVAITSYMSLLDLGLRGAVIRFVSRHYAAGKPCFAPQVLFGYWRVVIASSPWLCGS